MKRGGECKLVPAFNFGFGPRDAPDVNISAAS